MRGDITSRRFIPSRDLSEEECRSLVVGGSKTSIEEYLNSTGWSLMKSEGTDKPSLNATKHTWGDTHKYLYIVLPLK
jgi:hypothetical protein